MIFLTLCQFRWAELSDQNDNVPIPKWCITPRIPVPPRHWLFLNSDSLLQKIQPTNAIDHLVVQELFSADIVARKQSPVISRCESSAAHSMKPPIYRGVLLDDNCSSVYNQGATGVTQYCCESPTSHILLSTKGWGNSPGHPLDGERVILNQREESEV